MPKAERKPKNPPKGYKFSNDTHRWYWQPTPHWHINESNYGDVDGRAFKSEDTAKRELWRQFKSNYDFEQIVQYTHRPQDGTIDIEYPDDHQPNELQLGLLYCETPEDCYMVEAK
jgi:hypothetical protein